MPKIAFNAELAPKLVLLLVLATLVICGILTLVRLVVCCQTFAKSLAHVYMATLILSKHAAQGILYLPHDSLCRHVLQKADHALLCRDSLRQCTDSVGPSANGRHMRKACMSP